MNTAIITVKINPEEKKLAQKAAQDLGLPLSLIIKGFLREFVEKKTVTFRADVETPNKYLQKVLSQAEKNYKKGKTSPAFRSAKDAVKYLQDQGI